MIPTIMVVNRGSNSAVFLFAWSGLTDWLLKRSHAGR